MAKTHRFIFTGITGLDHETVLGELCSFAAKKLGPSRQDVRFYKLESFLPRGVSIVHLADAEEDEETKRQKWCAAFQDLEKRIRKDRPNVAFVSLHATVYRNSRIVSYADPWRIRKFQPEAFVTLIDDLYSAWNRINRGTELRRRSPETYCTLQELFNWRWAEIMATDHLARVAGKRNYVVAIKHPQGMLHRLLFEPQRIRVYACIPISQTRVEPNKLQKQGRVDTFRRDLHELYTVFDPLSIDEKLIGLALTQQYKGWHKTRQKMLYRRPLLIEKHERWPTLTFPNNSNPPLHSDWPDAYPITLDAGEAVEVCRAKSPRHPPVSDPNKEILDSVLDDHIRLRDFRLIDDSDVLAAYRPLFQGKSPGGQVREIQYAFSLSGRRKFHYVVYHDRKADGNIRQAPFHFLPPASIVYELDGLFGNLSRFQEEQSPRLQGT